MSSWQPPQGFNPSPYASPGGNVFQRPPPPPKPSYLWVWLLLGGGGVGLLCCCGGGVGLAFFGMNISKEEVAQQLRDNPKLREHIGEIETMETDMTASLAHDNYDTWIYSVKGTKGSGRLTVRQETDDDGKEVIKEATLRLPDGTEVQVVP